METKLSKIYTMLIEKPNIRFGFHFSNHENMSATIKKENTGRLLYSVYGKPEKCLDTLIWFLEDFSYGD